jgi:hypothetical protein
VDCSGPEGTGLSLNMFNRFSTDKLSSAFHKKFEKSTKVKQSDLINKKYLTKYQPQRNDMPKQIFVQTVAIDMAHHLD